MTGSDDVNGRAGAIGVRTVEEVRPRAARSEPERAPRGPSDRVWTAATVALAAAALLTGYARMARTLPVNADGASNALQAWDMLHGNVLLRGWTVTDVSFYGNELLIYAVVEVVHGFGLEVVRLGAAVIYMIVVLLVALLARGRSTGGTALVRVGIAVAIVLAPGPGSGYSVLLTSPDHTGTAIPLLLTWWVLERFTAGAGRPPQWLPWAVAGMLAWGQVSDPLVMYIGALPVVAVGAWRVGGRIATRSLASRRFVARRFVARRFVARRFVARRPTAEPATAGRYGGLDTRLIAAGAGSVLLAQAFLFLVRLLGGFGAHPPPTQFSAPDQLSDHVVTATHVLAVDFGGYLPQREGPLDTAIGALHLVGLVATTLAVLVVALRALRRPGGDVDRVNEILAVSIVVNVGAFVVSTLPGDLGSARQVVAVLPLGAALAGRVWAPPRLAGPICVGLLLIFTATFATQSTAPPTGVATEAQQAADWLRSQGLRYGLGSYWSANNLTLYTGGDLRVVPVTEHDDTGQIMAYRWEVRTDWYDPASHDARFLVLDLRTSSQHRIEMATAQFGRPLRQQVFGGFAVLVYDHNLLAGLPADCVPGVAASMAECPEPGSSIWR